MDTALVSYLDRRFEENRQETSKQFDRIEKQLGEQIGGLAVVAAEVGQVRALAAEVGQVRALAAEVGQIRVEMRQLHVLLEDQSSRLETVAEGVASNDQKISRLRSEMNEQFGDLKSVFNPAVRSLDRRVTDIEAR